MLEGSVLRVGVCKRVEEFVRRSDDDAFGAVDFGDIRGEGKKIDGGVDHLFSGRVSEDGGDSLHFCGAVREPRFALTWRSDDDPKPMRALLSYGLRTSGQRVCHAPTLASTGWSC